MICVGRRPPLRFCLLAAAFALLLPMVTILAQNAEQTVADVKVIGARRMPEAKVLAQVKTRKDQPYRGHIVREDVRKLDATGWYYSVAAEEQETADGVIVVFRVIERSTIQDVIYVGAKHLNKEELEGITGLKKGSPMSVALNKRAARAIEQHYHEKSRLLAQVDLLEGAKEEDLRVVFQITEGPIVRVRDIRFQGNQFVSAGRLQSQINTREQMLGFGGKYMPLMLEGDLARLTEYYRNFGFFDVKIRRELAWNEGQQSVDVVFVIDEGVRYHVGDFQIAGNGKVGTEVLLAKNELKPGDPFKGQVMQVSAKKMQDEYGKRGYVNSRIVPDLRFAEEPGTVHVVYQVMEGPPARLGEVKIVGNTHTRDEVIRRQIPVYPGQILDSTALRQAERNLERLTIFTDQQRGIRPIVSIIDVEGDSEFKDLLVQVEEQRTGSLLFGVGVNSDAGANASIILNERNFDITRFPTSFDDIWENRAFRGAGQEFRLELVPGTELNRFTVSFREPYLFDTPYSFGTSGYYYTRRFEDYDERRAGGRVTLGRRFTQEWSGSVSFRGERVKIDDFHSSAPPDFFEVEGNNTVLAPKIALSRDTRDSILRPTQGNHFEVSYEQGFGDFTFPILNIEDSQYWTVYERADGSGRHVISLRGQVGIAGDDTPLFERFYAGGFRTLRGFDFRGVGPDIGGYKVGGDFMLLGSVEYQIPIMDNDMLWAVIFSDFGTVESDIEINDVRVSVGAGLRLIVPMFGPVPLALDFGFPVRKKDTDEEQVFSFSVGFTR